MQSVIAPSRSRLVALFTQVGVVFDPQVVTYESVFVPSTVGAEKTTSAYTFGVGTAVVRDGVGSYYVELLFDVPGKLKFTWRSTAWGEEVTVEEIVNVVPRTVVI